MIKDLRTDLILLFSSINKTDEYDGFEIYLK